MPGASSASCRTRAIGSCYRYPHYCQVFIWLALVGPWKGHFWKCSGRRRSPFLQGLETSSRTRNRISICSESDPEVFASQELSSRNSQPYRGGWFFGGASVEDDLQDLTFEGVRPTLPHASSRQALLIKQGTKTPKPTKTRHVLKSWGLSPHKSTASPRKHHCIWTVAPPRHSKTGAHSHVTCGLSRVWKIEIAKRGVPQAYVRARTSSAMLCSMHVFRVFLCIFYIKKGIWYVSKRAWTHIWCTPLLIILRKLTNPRWIVGAHRVHKPALEGHRWIGPSLGGSWGVAIVATKPPNDYMHICITWEFISQWRRTSVSRGVPARIILCSSATSIRYSLRTQNTHENSLAIQFQLHAHLLHKRIVPELFV